MSQQCIKEPLNPGNGSQDPQKSGPSGWGGPLLPGRQAENFQLPAIAVAIPVPVTVAISVAIEISAPVVPIEIAAHKAVPIAVADKVPAARNPIAAVHVSGAPGVTRSRGRWNVGKRGVHVNSKLGSLSRDACQPRCPSQYRCSQHPVLHTSHNASVPAGPWFKISVTIDRPGSVPV